jgi:Uma2 family endonuclease
MDETVKLLSYINIPSLQEYVLIEQDYIDIQVIRRNESWLPRHYFLGDEITFESINLTLSVEEIYARVHNEEMLEFLSNQASQ